MDCLRKILQEWRKKTLSVQDIGKDTEVDRIFCNELFKWKINLTMVSLVHILWYVLEDRGNLPPTEIRKKDLLNINYFETTENCFLRFPNEDSLENNILLTITSCCAKPIKIEEAYGQLVLTFSAGKSAHRKILRDGLEDVDFAFPSL